MGGPNIIIISLFSLIIIIFVNSAQAVCVPRISPTPNFPPETYPPISHISAPTQTQTPAPAPAPSLAAYPPSKSPSPSPSPSFDPQTQTFIVPPNELEKTMDPAVKKICNTTDYPLICISAVGPYLNGKTDPLSVLEMALNASIMHTRKARIKATILEVGPEKSPSVTDCVGIYADALDNLRNAMDAIKSLDIGTINSMVSAALTDFDTCEDGFSGASPLSFYDQKGIKLASVCLAIATLVKS